MKMDVVFRKPRLLRALTSLDAGEFERLLAAFETAWQERRAGSTRHGQTRQRQPGGGHKGTLVTAREKLFFVLFYFKCYPLQEVMALFFGLSQPRVSHGVGALTPLVNAALGSELLLPARKPADQKGDYSGKKKSHRKKNLPGHPRAGDRLSGSHLAGQRA